MQTSLRYSIGVALAVLTGVVLTGCQAGKNHPGINPPVSAKPAPVVAAAAPVIAPSTSASVAAPIIRIKAGAASPFTDSAGNVWQADQGFDGGETAERPDAAIANTKDQALYQSEHYSMNSFSCPLPNGKYLAKLHFAETFEGITGTGQRVFSFTVQGREFKDFDVWAKAGGPYRAYVEIVPVEVTNGKFRIDFTSNIENPQINAIEIVPQ